MSGQEQWRLEDERDFLRRSLDDAAREHDAGDLGDEDYALLTRRDERRLVEVEAALGSLVALADAPIHDLVEARGGSARHAGAGERAHGLGADGGDAGSGDAGSGDAGSGDAGSGDAGSGDAGGHETLATAIPDRDLQQASGQPARRRRRRWLAVAGAACVAAGAVVLVVTLTTTRLPGEGLTGSITLTNAQKIERELTQAHVLVNDGRPTDAIALYAEVLTQDPKDPIALAEWGWLEWEAASKASDSTTAAKGALAVEQSVRLDSKLYASQYYLGTILFQEGHPSTAVIHYAAFLADDPTATWLKDAAPTIRLAYTAAHETLPAGVP